MRPAIQIAIALPAAPFYEQEQAYDDVLGTIIQRGTPAVAAAPAAVKGAVLPFTGAGDIYSLTAIALLLVAAGMVVLKLKKA